VGYARVQARLLNDSALPENAAMNVWHFLTPGAVSASTADIKELLEDFYEDVGAYLSSGLTGVGELRFFDLEDAPPRAPVDTLSMAFTPGGALQLPHEVALVLSFQGPQISGTPQARRRGRLFIGPLDGDVAQTGTGDARPTAAALNAITAAAEALMTQVTYAGIVWSVLSPTSAGPEPWTAGDLSAGFVTITNGWMDNAFDTMRSRGLAASSRTLFP